MYNGINVPDFRDLDDKQKWEKVREWMTATNREIRRELSRIERGAIDGNQKG